MEFKLTKENRKIVNAASKDTRRQILQCVHLKKGYIEASDGYILARQKIDYEGEDLLIDAQELSKAQTSLSKDIIYTVQENAVHATDNKNNGFALALQKGKFPETDNLFPKENPVFKIRLDKDLLARLLKSLSGDDLTFLFYSPTSQVKVEGEACDGLIMPMTPKEESK